MERTGTPTIHQNNRHSSPPATPPTDPRISNTEMDVLIVSSLSITPSKGLLLELVMNSIQYTTHTNTSNLDTISLHQQYLERLFFPCWISILQSAQRCIFWVIIIAMILRTLAVTYYFYIIECQYVLISCNTEQSQYYSPNMTKLTVRIKWSKPCHKDICNDSKCQSS